MDAHAQLLTTIARCPVVERCITDPSSTHDCSKIVRYQWPEEVPFEGRLERWQREHHLPEPWVGHLGREPGPPATKAAPLERLGEYRADKHPSLHRGLS